MSRYAFALGEQLQLGLQQARALLDGARRDPVAGLPAFHGRGDVDPEPHDLPDRVDIRARVLERLDGRLREERLAFRVVVVLRVWRGGFRDQDDANASGWISTSGTT
jgi:hypothetical protein